jgi:hypothetical protein
MASGRGRDQVYAAIMRMADHSGIQDRTGRPELAGPDSADIRLDQGDRQRAIIDARPKPVCARAREHSFRRAKATPGSRQGRVIAADPAESTLRDGAVEIARDRVSEFHDAVRNDVIRRCDDC